MAVLGVPRVSPPGLKRGAVAKAVGGGRGKVQGDRRVFIPKRPDNFSMYVHPAFAQAHGFRGWLRQYGGKVEGKLMARGLTFTRYRFTDYTNGRLAAETQMNWFGRKVDYI